VKSGVRLVALDGRRHEHITGSGDRYAPETDYIQDTRQYKNNAFTVLQQQSHQTSIIQTKKPVSALIACGAVQRITSVDVNYFPRSVVAYKTTTPAVNFTSRPGKKLLNEFTQSTREIVTIAAATMSETTPILPDPKKDHLPWSQRLHHFTWSWFEATMSTGALATLLGQQPYTFPGLNTIGVIFFLLDLALFILFSMTIAYRFISVPGSLSRSLRHPHESFFFGAYLVSISLLLYCIDLYGEPMCGHWLTKTVEVLYWTYAVVVMFVAVFQYHVIFDLNQIPVTHALPAWILPVYPFLMLGVLGSAMLKHQPSSAGLPIFVGSIAFQGLGWTVAYFMLAIYITRLINSEMPPAPKRPAMFVAVGPAAYTANTFVALGLQAPKHVPDGFLGITSLPVADVLKILGVIAGIFLWLVAFWFSALSVISVLVSARESHFTLNWWAFIFPNVGLIVALLQIANALNLRSVKIICSVATVIMVMLWLFVLYMNVRGVLRKELLWPGYDEDMEDKEGQIEDAQEDEG
jgi:C4-dicarboxylate transporter/malic acid transport protein